MDTVRVFVSYATTNTNQAETQFTQRLISDLRNAGVEIVTDNDMLSEAQFLAYLKQELPRCQWLLLLQTADSLRSLRTQVAVNQALQYVKQQSMQGVLRILCPSASAEPDPPAWSDTPTYLFQGDYQRLRDKVLLELNVLQIADMTKHWSTASTDGIPPAEVHTAQPAGMFHNSSAASPNQSAPPTPGDRPPALSSQSTKPAWFDNTRTKEAAAREALHNDRPASIPPAKKLLGLPGAIGEQGAAIGSFLTGPSKFPRLGVIILSCLLVVAIVLLFVFHAVPGTTPHPSPQVASIQATQPTSLPPTPTLTPASATPMPTQVTGAALAPTPAAAPAGQTIGPPPNSLLTACGSAACGGANFTFTGFSHITDLTMSVANTACTNTAVSIQLRIYDAFGATDTTPRTDTSGCQAGYVTFTGLHWDNNRASITSVQLRVCVNDAANTCYQSNMLKNPNV